MYTRGRATPTNPNSTAQQVARNALAELATAWAQTLTQAQRDAWAAYADATPVTDVFGDPLLLTGQQMYNRCNQPRLRAGATRVDDGPTTPGLPTFTAGNAVGSSSGPTWNVSYDNSDAWANEDDAHMLIQFSQPYSPARNFFKGPFRFSGTVDGDSTTAPTSPYSVANNPWGVPATGFGGKRFWARVCVTRADGRLSPVNIYTGPIS